MFGYIVRRLLSAFLVVVTDVDVRVRAVLHGADQPGPAVVRPQRPLHAGEARDPHRADGPQRPSSTSTPSSSAASSTTATSTSARRTLRRAVPRHLLPHPRAGHRGPAQEVPRHALARDRGRDHLPGARGDPRDHRRPIPRDRGRPGAGGSASWSPPSPTTSSPCWRGCSCPCSGSSSRDTSYVPLTETRPPGPRCCCPGWSSGSPSPPSTPGSAAGR